MNDDITRFFCRSTHCKTEVMRRIVTDIHTATTSLRLTRRITTWGTTEQPKICLYGGLPVNFSGSDHTEKQVDITKQDAHLTNSNDSDALLCILPIQVWITHQYPIEPPTIYMVCNPFLPENNQVTGHSGTPTIKIMSNHPNVDITGLCYCRELSDWRPASSSLCVLLERLGRALEQSGMCPMYIDRSNEARASTLSPEKGGFHGIQSAKREDDDMNNECVVCCSPRDTVLVPCGHFCLCMSCAANILECPMCRLKIKVRQRIFK